MPDGTSVQVGITTGGLCGVLNISDGFARVSAQIDWITDTACSMVEDLCTTVSPTVSPSKDKNEDIYKLFLIHLILLLKKGKAIHDFDLWSDDFLNLEYFFHYLLEAHPKLEGTSDDLDEIEIKLIELLEERKLASTAVHCLNVLSIMIFLMIWIRERIMVDFVMLPIIMILIWKVIIILIWKV